MGGDDFWCAERTTHKGVPNGGRGEREREGKIGGKKRRKNERERERERGMKWEGEKRRIKKGGTAVVVDVCMCSAVE